MNSDAAQDNPLFRHGALPRFDEIESRHVVPGLRALLAELEVSLQAIEAEIVPSWSGLIEPLEAMGERLQYAWGLVGHLMGVRNSEPLREAFREIQGEVIAFGLRQAQSRIIYEGFQAIESSDEFLRLEPGQRRIVEGLLRDATHAGVGLPEAERERFNAIQAELAELGTNFSNHVLDATGAFSLVLTREDEIAGAPESLRQLAAQSEREAGNNEDATAESGPWRITLDAPSLMPFLEHCARRDLRDKLYRAYVTRASEGKFDNTPIIERILELRSEMSRLLGFANYAEFSLDSKMAPSIESVEDLLEELRTASIDSAKQDLDTLREFARERGQTEPLELWDVAYYAERLREERFDYSEEELRPYFPLPRVLNGLFGLAERLFGVRIVAADGETSVWHPDIRFFRVQSEDGEEMAAFYLDPYSRPGEKRGGAWMDECLGRTRRRTDVGPVELLPVAYLVCNQSPPVDDRPSLMSFDEVVTLFHEFGHGLQHMLTRVDFGLASGIRNIEWDAVELPSQFMENWCYQRETLIGLSENVHSGESLPDELFDKIDAARTYRAGTQMLRQIYFASMDLALHLSSLSESDESIFDVQRRIANRTTVLAPLDEDRFLCSFGHIFAGGYAAGYYSYKWAEVLDADAFERFEEEGLFNPNVAADFSVVLQSGGTVPPDELYRNFRGRDPKVDALLKRAGISA